MKLARLSAIGILLLLALSGAEAAAAQLETFTVTPAFSPFSTPGRTVTIKGVGFTAATTVKFGAISAAKTFVDSRTIVATVPTVPAATIATVTVSDPVNGSDTFHPFLHTGPALFVATTGNDSNTGTTPASPKKTLAAAFAAASGTTPTEIRVAAGQYLESQLALLNASVLSCGWAPGFGSRDTQTQITEIDGRRRGFVVRSSGLANISVIDGCTIINGLRDGFGGGGVAISADSAVVNDNVIIGNDSTLMGGGIYFRASVSYGGTSTFSNNVIVGNRSHAKTGGGITIYPNYNSQMPVKIGVSANFIVGNRSFKSSGGGISFATASYSGYNTVGLMISNNTVHSNRAKGGAGIEINNLGWSDYLDLVVNNNLIARNTSSGGGGGLSLIGAGTIEGSVAGNTISENVAAFGHGGGFNIGGAISLGPQFSARDMILWGNVGDDAGGMAVGTVTYSDSGTPLSGAGNISSDPAFAGGAMGDFYLTQNDPNQADSPAVDAGSGMATDVSVENLTTSLDGSADGGVADMGYHYGPAALPSAAPVAITRLDPTVGDMHGNDWVLIRGDGFDPGAHVTFDSVPATDEIFVSNRRILARPAPHASTLVHVRVTNPDASFAQMSFGYRYVDNDPPVWQTTTGIVGATSGVDLCQRTVMLSWNPAIDVDSPPVGYEIYREECIDSLNPNLPCDNFGYIPNATNFLGTTFLTSFVDGGFTVGGADKRWVYAVRAFDSEPVFGNKEWNFGKKVVTASVGSVEILPAEVGDTLGFAPGSAVLLDWADATGAVKYGVYREGTGSAYANPGLLTKLITLTSANNDANGDGVTDSQFQDAAVPAPGAAFLYKISALDSCNAETLSEL